MTWYRRLTKIYFKKFVVARSVVSQADFLQNSLKVRFSCRSATKYLVYGVNYFDSTIFHSYHYNVIIEKPHDHLLQKSVQQSRQFMGRNIT